MEFHTDHEWMRQIRSPFGFGIVEIFIQVQTVRLYKIYSFLKIPVIMKGRRIDKQTVEHGLKTFVDYFLGAWLVGASSLSFICPLR